MMPEGLTTVSYTHLLDMVFVTKVSMNPGKTHLRVYIESSRWIHKKNILSLIHIYQKG